MKRLVQKKGGFVSLIMLLIALAICGAIYYFYFKESPTGGVRMDAQIHSLTEDHQIDTSTQMKVMETTISRAKDLEIQQQERMDQLLHQTQAYK